MTMAFDILSAIEALPEEPYPSAMGAPLRASWAGQCARQVSYRVAGVEAEPYQASSLIAFTVGHALHDLVQRALSALHPMWHAEEPGALCVHADVGMAHPVGPLRACEGSDRVVLGCHADFATEECVWEIKSMQTFAFQKEPAPHHILQAGLCALALDVPRTELVYVDKAKGDVEVYPFEVQKDALDEAIRLARVITHKEAPRISPTRMHWQCKYCPFYEHCGQDE
jgi:CRISPR/Cas system-associated exonuclease Cas4 (RecB family)